MCTATDVAGEVVDVGQGVQKFKPGDKVVAFLTQGVSAHFGVFVLLICFMLIQFIKLTLSVVI